MIEFEPTAKCVTLVTGGQRTVELVTRYRPFICNVDRIMSVQAIDLFLGQDVAGLKATKHIVEGLSTGQRRKIHKRISGVIVESNCNNKQQESNKKLTLATPAQAPPPRSG